MITTETTCLSDEFCLCKEEEEEEVGQIVRFSYRACTRPFVRFWSIYSQLHKKVVCEFEGFENVLRDAGICAIPI